MENKFHIHEIQFKIHSSLFYTLSTLPSHSAQFATATQASTTAVGGVVFENGLSYK